MMRINLLPDKKRTKHQSGQRWLVVLLLLSGVCVVLYTAFHQYKLQQLEVKETANNKVKGQITAIRAKVKDHDELKKKLEQLRAREQTIASLQAARSGPTAVLMELSKILTTGKGPSISAAELAQKNKEMPQEVHNIGWDARRLWLVSFKEIDKLAKLEGMAQDAEDVSELARRLSLSPLFYDVVLLPAKQQTDPTTKRNVVSFQLEAKVRY